MDGEGEVGEKGENSRVVVRKRKDSRVVTPKEGSDQVIR